MSYEPSDTGFECSFATRRRKDNCGSTPGRDFAESFAHLSRSETAHSVERGIHGPQGLVPGGGGELDGGKTYTMLGVDDSSQNLGVIPCAIAWLFKLINEQKDRTGARFSVRVSAVEVTGKQEKLKDLLAEVAGGTEAGSTTAPGVYLREDPICGLQIENQSELRAPTADQASYYLDAAIAARTIPAHPAVVKRIRWMAGTPGTKATRSKIIQAGHDLVHFPADLLPSGCWSTVHLPNRGRCVNLPVERPPDETPSTSPSSSQVLLLHRQVHISPSLSLRQRRATKAEEDARNSHLLFTLSVYQYRVEKSTKGQDGVAGGRSRLHLLDLGSCSKRDTSGSNALSLSALGNVILALLNGQRHVPHRDSKLTQLIKESLGNWSCRTCMIAHVSPAVHAYNETLQVIQLAARIHRMKRRSRNKWSSTSSDDSSCDGQSVRMRRMRPGVRMGILREDGIGGFSHSDPDYSSSEQSCDTVIYVGANGQALSDRELTDNEGPPPVVTSFPKSSSMPSEANIPEEEPNLSGDKVQEDQVTTIQMSKGNISKPGAMTYTSKLPPKSPLRTAMSNQTAPVSGVVQLPRKMNPKLKSQAHVKQKVDDLTSHDQMGNTESEKWIDGPGAPPCQTYMDSSAASWRDSSMGSVAEPWIYSSGRAPDGQYYAGVPPSGGQYFSGPGMSAVPVVPEVNNQQGSEHWVDGPHVPATAPVPIKDTELWVDGPSAFRVESLRLAPRVGRMWTEMPRDSASPVSHSHSLKSTPKVCRKEPTHQKVKSRTLEIHKPTTQLATEVLEPKPIDQTNAESNSSLSVNADSERNSCQSEKESAGGKKMQDLAVQTQAPPMIFPVKAFVHDWVVKHSISSVESAEDDTAANPAETRKSRIAKPTAGKKHHLSKHTKTTVDDMALSRQTQSPERCISSAQSSPRLRRLRKHGLPVQSQLTVRTAAWVMSITEETTSQSSPSGNLGNHKVQGTDSALGCSNVEPICEQDLPGSPPPDYDSCMEESLISEHLQQDVDVDFEKQLDSTKEDVRLRRKEDDFSVGDNADRDMADCDKYSVDAQSANKESLLDVNSLLLSNRESIYELQMDEQLEYTDNLRKNASGSDDMSAWSSGSYQNVSLPHKEVVSMNKAASDVALHDGLSSPVHGDNESGIASGSGGLISPPSSLDEKRPSKLVRPSSLRRPDGASNPNLTDIESEKDVALDAQYPCKGEALPLVKCMSEPIRNPAADGQSPQGNSPTVASKPASRLPVKSSVQSSTKSVPSSKPPSARCSRSLSLPVRNVAKPSQSEVSSVCSSASSSPTKSASTPASAKTSPIKCSNKSKLPKVSTPTSGTSPSQEKVHFSRSSSTKSSKSSKLVSSGSNKNGSALKSNSAKESKSSLRATSKSPSPSKRDKESRLPKFNNSLAGHRSRHTDSDSGNDSGIVKNDRKFLSPYSKLTKPRVSSYSTSSGHGSDNSSTFAGANSSQPNAQVVRLSKIESSSGYDSMLREDSEITGASSHDSTSESSSGGNSRSSKLPKKKDKSGRRSRSAPARSTSESPTSCAAVQSPASCRRVYVLPSSRAWVDTRRCTEVVIEPLELKSYDEEELEKMARRRREAQLRASEKHTLKVAELLVRQEQLKNELMEAKSMLMVDKSTWSFDYERRRYLASSGLASYRVAIRGDERLPPRVIIGPIRIERNKKWSVLPHSFPAFLAIHLSTNPRLSVSGSVCCGDAGAQFQNRSVLLSAQTLQRSRVGGGGSSCRLVIQYCVASHSPESYRYNNVYTTQSGSPDQTPTYLRRDLPITNQPTNHTPASSI
ncbi:hypothetical protein LSH36_83g06061 [Paralvinella palmiformis]|uniref:Kinesin motor domain-containing protein n=1 Tax=Paralvinella palmiformis TaxID=53620 RepID=A0AAD9K3J0_9ANNE|nr:hypothetical protein LSH36_83g06061 [Paralvinella palmiformis]